LLAFVLGIWMWDHYFSEPAEYMAGTEEVALLKIDRDLRLAEAMADDPLWLRRLAGSVETRELCGESLEILETLEAQQLMGPRGIEAYAVIRSVADGSPVLETMMRFGAPSLDASPDPVLRQGSWWRAKILRANNQLGLVPGPWKEAYAESLQTLRWRAIASGSAIGALGLIGLCFVPRTLHRLAAGLRERPRGYGGAWSPALGLTVFMVGTLAWIGFVAMLDLGVRDVIGLPPLMAVMLDTAARLLPSLIVIGFLFKQPAHAVRVMGLNRAPHPRMMLGMFTLLLVADRLLRLIPGAAGEGEPGGGLSLAEGGINGLIFVVISACIVAPIAEEVLYRGVLFRSLGNRLGILPAAILSSVIFSSIHFYGLYGFVSVAVFGFSCALLYAATGSLVSVILLHALYNFSIKVPEWLFYHAKIEW
jgi:membrane protease YdiL (CAAX protease family)